MASSGMLGELVLAQPFVPLVWGSEALVQRLDLAMVEATAAVLLHLLHVVLRQFRLEAVRPIPTNRARTASRARRCAPEEADAECDFVQGGRSPEVFARRRIILCGPSMRKKRFTARRGSPTGTTGKPRRRVARSSPPRSSSASALRDVLHVPPPRHVREHDHLEPPVHLRDLVEPLHAAGTVSEDSARDGGRRPPRPAAFCGPRESPPFDPPRTTTTRAAATSPTPCSSSEQLTGPSPPPTGSRRHRPRAPPPRPGRRCGQPR